MPNWVSTVNKFVISIKLENSQCIIPACISEAIANLQMQIVTQLLLVYAW